MNINQHIENTEKSEQSTIGYNCYNDQQISVLDCLNYRRTFQIMKDHFETFQIIQRAPYHMATMITQYQNNKKEILDGVAGSGGYGQVFYAEHIGGMPCVVKVQKIDDFEEFLQQLNEYKVQQTLNKVYPQNFVELIDKVTILQENINTFSSYAGLEIALTTLDVYLLQVKIDYEEFYSIYHQILRSIINMHTLKIAHRDIKPSNIMYIYNKGWVIGDFGCALKYKNQIGIFKIEGTTQYLPKKYRGLLQGKQFTEVKMDLFENDVYSFLLTMLKIYFQESTLYQLQNMLDDQNTYNQLPQEFQILTKNLYELSSFLERSVLKIPLQKQLYDEKYNLIKITLQQIRKKRENFIPILFNLFHFSNRIETKGYFNYIKNEALKYDDLKIYIELMDPYFTLKDSTQMPQITSKTTFEQYEILSNYWFRLGNINQQLKLCQQYQQLQAEYQFQLKLQELSILMFKEDYQQGDQIIINLLDDEQNMDDITFIQFQIIKAIRGRIWLEVADQFEYWVNEGSIYIDYKENWLFLKQGNLSWLYQSSIIKHYYTPKHYNIHEMVKQENQIFSLSSTNLPRWIELCNWKGLDHVNSVKEMIKQLEQRGADIYGIKFFIQQLIKRIDMNDDKQKIINLFETAILYYQNHFCNSHYFWELYFHFSQYCFSIKDFEKSMELALMALKLVDIDNQYFYIQIELMIIGILTKQNNFDQSKERISKFWQLIAKINSKKSRSILLQKLHSIFSLFFQNHQVENLELIYNGLSNYVEQEKDNSIIIQCQSYRADLAFFIKNRQQMIKIYQSWIPFCQDTQNFDPYLFQIYYKYVYVQQQLMKNEGEKKQYLKDLGKYIQNSIVYDDILGLKGQELLRIQSSQWQYLQGAEQLNEEQLFNQIALQQQKYIEYNCYQDINIIKNLNNVQINYTQ